MRTACLKCGIVSRGKHDCKGTNRIHPMTEAKAAELECAQRTWERHCAPLGEALIRG